MNESFHRKLITFQIFLITKPLLKMSRRKYLLSHYITPSNFIHTSKEVFTESFSLATGHKKVYICVALPKKPKVSTGAFAILAIRGAPGS